MLTVCYSTRQYDQSYDEVIRKSCGLKEVHIISYQNKGDKSLSKVYNEALKICEDRYCVFIHDDLDFSKCPNWGEKLIRNFEETDYGIIGVAGTTKLNKSGIWWENRTALYGQVWHRNNNKTYQTYFCPEQFNRDIQEVCCIDGLFIAVDKTKLNSQFDESIPGFHFYDIAFCVRNWSKGTRIGVCFNIPIIHKSIGRISQEWQNTRQLFCDKYNRLLPLVQNIDVPYEDLVFYEKTPKVGIIIPTKGSPELVEQCVKSFREKSFYCNYKIYVADTGATTEELAKLKELSEKYDFTLKTYDWYNFAGINNDMVNYVDSDTELLLFCNNDVCLINDALMIMVHVFNEIGKVGTVGARLHYEDGTLQHYGVRINWSRSMQTYIITHNNLKMDYNNIIQRPKVMPVFGNTGGFMMVRKKLFESVGGFNTTYKDCFEDVEFNLKLLTMGYKNILAAEAVCWHFEGMTRKGITSSEDVSEIQKYISGNEGLSKYIKTKFSV